MASFNTSGGINGAGFTIQGDFTGSFDRMVNELPDICNKALNTGAYIIKEAVKSVFASRMPAAARAFKVPATTKGGYKITRPDRLVDAVMQSKAKTTHATVSVRGSGTGSPMFISRMYDKGTTDRYVTTRNGVKLKTKRYVGSIKGVNYFQPGVVSGENEAYNAMQRIFENSIEKTLEQ